MIDIHTHILPQIDDGSQSLDESLILLKLLEDQGVERVVLTPHYYGRNKGISEFLAKREEAYIKLTEAYRGNINLIKGCECNIATCANSNFDDLEKLSIENTRYIVTEMSFDRHWDNEIWTRLYRLIDTGLIPIIAHVELYPAVASDPKNAYRLQEAGCLLQINCDSVLDNDRFNLVKALIDHGQAHCLGSDTHNTDKRPPHYKLAKKMLENLYGSDLIRTLQKNMSNILADKQVVLPTTRPIKKTLFGNYK